MPARRALVCVPRPCAATRRRVSSEFFLHVELPGLDRRLVCRVGHEHRLPDLGEPVGISLPLHGAHVFDGTGRRLGGLDTGALGALGAVPLREVVNA